MTQTGFEQSSTADLRTLVLKMKTGIIGILNLPKEDRDKPGSDKHVPAQSSLWIRVSLLACMEKDILRRGMDPRHPCFGQDVIGFISENLVEMTAAGVDIAEGWV